MSRERERERERERDLTLFGASVCVTPPVPELVIIACQVDGVGAAATPCNVCVLDSAGLDCEGRVESHIPAGLADAAATDVALLVWGLETTGLSAETTPAETWAIQTDEFNRWNPSAFS